MTTSASVPSAPVDRARVIAPGDGARYQPPSADLPLPSIEILLDGQRGAPFSVMVYEVPGGFAPPPVLHRHTREFGAVFVLEGELRYWFEAGEAVTAVAGSLVVLGRDWFRWTNPTDRAARIMCIFSPAGFEQFFADVHTSMAEVSYDMERFGEILMGLRAAYGDEAHPGR